MIDVNIPQNFTGSQIIIPIENCDGIENEPGVLVPNIIVDSNSNIRIPVVNTTYKEVMGQL